MKDLRDKVVLLICPVFYEYHKDIITSLESFGAKVIFFPDMKSTINFRLVKNFSSTLFQKYIYSYYYAISKKIGKVSIDYLFLIKGAYVPADFVSELTSRNENIVLINYLWDSKATTPNLKNIQDRFDITYSFDRVDCLNDKSLKYLPLFCVNKYLNLKNNQDLKYDVLFVGYLTKERYLLLEELQEYFNSIDLTFYFYAYIPFLQYLKERLVRKNRMSLNKVRFRKLNNKDITKLYSYTNAVLDLPNSRQTGYPIRVFEALGAHKKLITTSTHIKREKFYNSELIMVLNNNIKDIKSFVKNSHGNWNNSNILTIDQWIKEIFSFNK